MGSRAKLSIGTAIQDGWHAFRLAPWAFVGFVLLSSLLAQLASVIPLFGALVATLVNAMGRRRPDSRLMDRIGGHSPQL